MATGFPTEHFARVSSFDEMQTCVLVRFSFQTFLPFGSAVSSHSLSNHMEAASRQQLYRVILTQDIHQHRLLGKVDQLPRTSSVFWNSLLTWKFKEKKRYECMLKLSYSRQSCINFDIPFSQFQYRHLFVHIGGKTSYSDPLLEVRKI